MNTLPWLAGLAGSALVGLAWGLALYWWVLLGASRWPAAAGEGGQTPKEFRFVILVPAHDEAAGIRRTLESVRGLDYPEDRFRIVVIADNCQDRTAEISRSVGGVEVLERDQERRRGKDFAIEWALQRVESDPWDAVVIIDADTLADRDLLRVFAAGLERGDAAQQASCRTLDPSSGSTNFTGALGRFVETELFYRGKERLGLAVFLLGTGMCLSRRALGAVPWATGSLTEDTEYSLRLLEAGSRPHFRGEAVVTTLMPETAQQFRTQRDRWARGVGRLLLPMPRLLASALLGGRPLLADAAWTLLAANRPLGLGVALLSLLAATPLLWLAGASWGVALLLAGLPLLLMLAYVAAAAVLFAGWRRGLGAMVRSAPAILRLVASTLRGLRPGGGEWKRTPRSGAIRAPNRDPPE